MTEAAKELRPCDGLEIISLVDNYVTYTEDSGPGVERAPIAWEDKTPCWLRAEHGFAALVRVRAGSETHEILFDGGMLEGTAVENLRQLRIKNMKAEALVLSHGHIDHWGGVPELLSFATEGGQRRIPLVLHPHVFRKRQRRLNDGSMREIKAPDRVRLEAAGADLMISEGPISLAGGLALTTGQVARETAWETGMPRQEALIDGEWQPDEEVFDDQSMLFHLEGKGLVVLTGCAHSGIVNTLCHALKLAGIDTLYAVMGGFHLGGKDMAPRVEPTIAELKKLNPHVMIPTHCTGWDAMNRMHEEFADAFILNSVGTRYEFGKMEG